MEPGPADHAPAPGPPVESRPPVATQPPVESRHLRSAIEFAIEVARVGQRQRPPLQVPDGLRPLLGGARIPTGALGRARRVIEEAPEFRRALSLAATPELVDEVGRLWLEEPEGWSVRVAEILAGREREAAERAEANSARRERRRREAAEQAAVRTRTELAALAARIEELEVALATEIEGRARLEAEVATLRERVAGEQRAARHARDREGAARSEAERLREALASATGERRAVETARDMALADRAAHRVPDAQAQEAMVREALVRDARVREAQVREALASAERLLAQLVELLPASVDLGGAKAAESGAGAQQDQPGDAQRLSPGGSPGESRRPLALPAGVRGDSDLAVDHLMRSGAIVLVDGYNVTMAVWPELEVAAQRQRLIDVLEGAARRAGTEFVIVFDGADVVGGHGPRRLVRVVFSPDGVTADDVIRGEMSRVPTVRAVVVVTDDGEIQRDARRAGANVVPGAALYRWCQR